MCPRNIGEGEKKAKQEQKYYSEINSTNTFEILLESKKNAYTQSLPWTKNKEIVQKYFLVIENAESAIRSQYLARSNDLQI